MCIVVIVGPDASPDGALVVAANRDEYHARPTHPLHWWPDVPAVAGGRDARAGGSWLAVRRDGRFAALLNAGGETPPAAPSRGDIVRRFVAGEAADADELQAVADRHAPFHCLAGGPNGIRHVARGQDTSACPAAAVIACGNHGLERPGPRVERARAGVVAALAASDRVAGLFAALADAQPLEPGAGDDRPVFIHDSGFGTRATSILIIGCDGRIAFHERSFNAHGSLEVERSLGWNRVPVQ